MVPLASSVFLGFMRAVLTGVLTLSLFPGSFDYIHGGCDVLVGANYL